MDDDYNDEVNLEVRKRRLDFVKWLKENSKDAYGAYLHYVKLAEAQSKDPFRYLMEYAGKGNQEEIERLRYLFLKKRLISPTQEDIKSLSDTLKKCDPELDLEALCAEIHDPRMIADIIVHMNLEKFLNEDALDGVYFVVDKITSGRSNGNRPPVVLRGVPPKYLAEPKVAEVSRLHRINSMFQRFQDDFEEAEEHLCQEIAQEANPLTRKLLEQTLEYFREVRDYKIPGVNERFYDTEKEAMVNFPALHQKITPKMLLEKKRLLLADEMGLGKTAQAIICKPAMEQASGNKMTTLVIVPHGMLDHWEKQIGLSLKDPQKIRVITSENKFEINKIVAEKPDFIFVTYEMIFRKVNGTTVGKYLAEHAAYDYVVLDEEHNVKNEESRRSKEINMLCTAPCVKHLLMLSGTPFPNSFEDMGVTMTLLAPDKYLTPGTFNHAFNMNSRVVRAELVPRMLRRTNSNVYGERDCQIHEVMIPANTFQSVMQPMLDAENISTLHKIQKLRRLAIDPSLYGLDAEPQKYVKLLELIRESKDGKWVVFSSELRDGITDKLENYLNANGIETVRVDGTVQGDKRDNALSRFRKGSARVLIATLDTMGEGVEFTNASNMAFIDVPFTHAELRQGIARENRKGQKEKVNVHMLMTEGSVDEILWRVIHQKLRMEQFLLDGVEIFDFEKRMLKSAKGIVEPKVRDEQRELYRIFGMLKGRSASEITKILRCNTELAKFVARIYDETFIGSYSHNTSKVCAKIIADLESETHVFNKILDIGSNSACFSRVSRRPTACLDINVAALEIGKSRLAAMGVEISTHAASFMSMPFEAGSFDAAVFSLALHYTSNNEREHALREASRVLRPNGVLLITLPRGSSSLMDLPKFKEGLEKLGLKPIPSLSGTAIGIEPVDAKFRVDVFACTKASEPPVGVVGQEYFEFKKKEYKPSGGHKKKSAGRITPIECSRFKIDGIGLDDAAVIAKQEVEKRIEEMIATILEKMSIAGSENELKVLSDVGIDILTRMSNKKRQEELMQQLINADSKEQQRILIEMGAYAKERPSASDKDKVRAIERKAPAKGEVVKPNAKKA